MKTILHQFKNTIMLSLLLLAYTASFSQTATAPTTGNGTEGNPYQIATLNNLYWLSQSDTVWDKHFTQTVDIDARTTKTWDSNEGFTPIGNETIKFTGTYNGKLHTIDGLYINRPSEYIGMFGYIDGSAKIDSLGVSNVNIAGNKNIGGLAGCNNGIINSCYTSGSVNSITNGNEYANIGGLVGQNKKVINTSYSLVNITEKSVGCAGGLVGFNISWNAKITNCYSRGDITGLAYIGGLVGSGYNSYIITNCYSTGKITSPYPHGGLIGGGRARNSFWDTETSGQNESGGGTGLTTAEMKDIKNYLKAGWDFMDETYNDTNNYWGCNGSDNDGYPFLSWQGYTNNELSCQAPISPVSNIIFGNIETNSIKLNSFTKGGFITQGYVIYINTVDNWEVPTDGTTPTADTVWRNTGQQCIYSDNLNTPYITVTGLSLNTKYFFKVFAYNNCSNIKKYETTGTVASKFTKVSNTIPNGDGSESKPYVIANLENLAWFMYNSRYSNTLGKHYIQIANINAAETKNWDNGLGYTPILRFYGHYNAKGYVIDNLYINRPTTDNVGLFAYLDARAQIDSLGLTNVDINGGKYIGALSAFSRSVINNCYTTGSIKSDASDYDSSVGGILGVNSEGIINNSYSLVDITAANVENVGGLVGKNGMSSILNCYSMGSITGGSHTGGLVGKNYNGDIINSYSTGKVTSASEHKGGLLGYNYGSVKTCFWDTITSGLSTSAGGTGLSTAQMKDYKKYLNAGWDFMDETANGNNDYWGMNSAENNGYPFLSWQQYVNNVTVTCQAPFAPVDSISFGTYNKNSINLNRFSKGGYITKGYAIYINTVDSWAAPVNGDTPSVDTAWKNTGQQCICFDTLTKPNVTVTGLAANTKYFFKIYAYNTCSGTTRYETTGTLASQFTKVTNTLPSGEGSENNPYIIANIENLVWLMYNDTAWNKHYIQTTDINASVTKIWADTCGFIPIGNTTTKFTGTYNGMGHTIDQLYINRPTTDTVGLFGYIYDGARIDSLGLGNVDIKGNKFVGGLAGYNKGSISNCYTSGVIKSDVIEYVYCGGFIGYSDGNIYNSFSTANVIANNGNYVGGFFGISNSNNNCYNCYAMGDVTGNNYIGGFDGGAWGSFTNCYSTGKVVSSNASPSRAGGFTGFSSGKELNCFWDTETSGQNESGGGTGLTTAEMKDIKNYLKAGWDFIDETYNGSNDYWGLNSSENGAYPFLAWQGYINTTTQSCSAPLTPVSNISFGDAQINSINLKSLIKSGYFTKGYAIYVNTSDNWTAPVDDTTPIVDTAWKNTGQQCICFDTLTKPDVTVTGLATNTKYFFKIYAYSICSGIKTYETTGALASYFTKIESTIPNGEGSENTPYIIANLDNLIWLMYNDTAWDKHYIQTADIDASTTKYWNDTTGFNPIGNYKNKFTGTYNGNNYNIDSLYINLQSSKEEHIKTGFFGYTGDNAIISNLNLTNVDITGKGITGGLAGINLGTITNCSTTGKVSDEYARSSTGGLVGCNNNNIISTSYSLVNTTGSGWNTGGLVGSHNGKEALISNCYSMGNVTGDATIGGLVGRNSNYASIKNCYSTGEITSPNDYNKGGFVGSNNNRIGLIITSFWDIETSGISDSTIYTNVTGLTSSDMKADTKYLNDGWDFRCETENGTKDIWDIDAIFNNGYPFLAWQRELLAPIPDVDNLTDLTGQYSVTVTTAPTATDNCSGTITGTSTYGATPFTLNESTTIVWTYTDDAGNTTTQNQQVIITNISDNIYKPEEMGISIYPNPVNDMLNIVCNNKEMQSITIIDILGKTVFEKTNLSQTESINMSEIPSGIYIIRINKNRNSIIHRIIKK